MAQQAYRKRKETTISNLQARVQKLEGGIENFSQSFLSFSNLLLEARLLESHPEIANSLQNITQECVSLAQQGSDDPDENADGDTSADSKKPNAHRSPQSMILDKELELFREYNIYNSAKTMPPFISHAQWPKMTQSPRSPQNQDPISDISSLPFGLVLSSDSSPKSSRSSQGPLTPPEAIFSNSIISDELWTLSHRIVRECCKAGYRLLAEQSHQTEKIKEIFGGPLTTSERNRKLTAFFTVANTSAEEVVEVRANVIESVKRLKGRLDPSSEEYGKVPMSWRWLLEADSDEWLDANGVQKLLYDKGLLEQEKGLPNHGIVLSPYSRLNVTAFISGMMIRLLQTTQIPLTCLLVLSLGSICVGPGPAFRRLDVENALLLATNFDPPDSWSYGSSWDISGYPLTPSIPWAET